MFHNLSPRHYSREVFFIFKELATDLSIRREFETSEINKKKNKET